MLDNETKRRINTARDILVGKIPDPKSQVEQITIALIYKFMDDMDKQSENLPRGKAKFFTGEYKKYAWRSILSPQNSGENIVILYSEALQKMNFNENVPQLFRDIFKNAYLPFRDPETLKDFLKEINTFEYDHSERLGDAFEYLLSVLGSQGDAGQFRTPRNIIDFMVEIIEPKKNEKVLDPACGTAGFLISAYKHILKRNSKNYDPENDLKPFELQDIKLSELTIDGKGYRGEKLTSDDKKRLVENITGYDISPDMVRLSLVNMYLHGFSSPNISEYDTLSRDDKWDEKADVILANPPFMSPKGGIKPHSRFSVQSKRSEVLFVDYMAEHLTPNGRAAIIVPEGIIFQTGSAYKELRKMLVDGRFLAGVISLPAGLFNPYSGVKTSILWLDKTLAKKTDKILFVKIENDGFDLGAQRRPIKKNDLPDAYQAIIEYKRCLLEDDDFVLEGWQNISIVEKTKIAEGGEYNLSGERYKENKKIITEYPLITVDEAIERVTYTNKVKSSAYEQKGKFPIVDQSEKFIAGYWNDEKDVFHVTKPVTLFGDHTRTFKYIDFDFVLGADGIKILQPNNRFDAKFFFYFVSNVQLQNLGYSRHYKELKGQQIPLPPLLIQQEIVAELDSYQKIIDGARQVVENYKPHIDIDPEWEMVEVKKIAKINNQTADPKDLFKEYFTYIDISSVENGTGKIDISNQIRVDKAPSRARRIVKKYDILLSTVRPNLKAFGFLSELPENPIASTGFAVISASEKCDAKYLYYTFFTQCLLDQMIARMGKGAYPSINQTDVGALKVPMPHIETQKSISKEIDREQQIVNSNKQLIEIYEQKIKDRIAKVWGEK